MHFYHTIFLDSWHQQYFAVHEKKKQIFKKTPYVFLFFFSGRYLKKNLIQLLKIYNDFIETFP